MRPECLPRHPARSSSPSRPMARKIAVVLLVLALCSATHAEQTKMQPSNKIIEILTIDVKPGKRDEFHKLYETEALPLLRKWKFDVIAHGPSLHTRIAIMSSAHSRAWRTGNKPRTLTMAVTTGRMAQEKRSLPSLTISHTPWSTPRH